jgi:hypothetical protein
MHWRIPIVGALALLVAVNCQQPVEPQQEVVVTAPAFDFSNGPAVPGNSYIVRDEWGGFAWLFTDAVTDLGVLVTSDDTACIDFEGATLIPFQTIFNPSGEGLEMYHEAGWLNAAILEPPYECDDVLAVGRVHNRWLDNDQFAWRDAHHRANTWGGGLNGRVGNYTVSARWRCLWGGLTKPEFSAGHCNSKVTVK